MQANNSRVECDRHHGPWRVVFDCRVASTRDCLSFESARPAADGRSDVRERPRQSGKSRSPSREAMSTPVHCCAPLVPAICCVRPIWYVRELCVSGSEPTAGAHPVGTCSAGGQHLPGGGITTFAPTNRVFITPLDAFASLSASTVMPVFLAIRIGVSLALTV